MVHSDFSSMPKIETFSLDVKQNSPPGSCLYCEKAWSWLYFTVQKIHNTDVFLSWTSLCFEKLCIIILTDTAMLCSLCWWQNQKLGYKQQESLNWSGRHCHVLKSAGICTWICHPSKLKAKLRNVWREWESAVSLVEIFGTVAWMFRKHNAWKSSAVTSSDYKIRFYSVHAGTYASAFGRIELLSKLVSLRLRFSHSSSNSPEQHKCLFDSELWCWVTQPVTYTVLICLLVWIDLSKIIEPCT